MHNPTVISTFSGCGGSSLGYKMAGFDVKLAVEWDSNAVETYKINFPNTEVYHGDISKLSIEEIFDRSGLGPKELDVFDGSPPCQGFSMAGSRDSNDDRNQLFKEYVRLLDSLQPKAFVMENVKGMIGGKMKLIFSECLKDLKSCGYNVSVRLLNSSWYGVPQLRERVIFIGFRNDLNKKPTHPEIINKKPITVGEALKDSSAKTFVECKGWGLKAWNLLKPGENLSKYNVDFSGKGSGFGHQKLSPINACPTILKSPTFTNTGMMHWLEPRSMAIEEIQLLASFPSSFQFLGSFNERWARIGNSVPPLMMKAIASSIRQQLSI